MNNSQPIYNSRIINTYIKFVKNRYSYVNISDLLKHAGMELYQIEDQGHWFTQEQINLFYEKLKKMTGNERIAREAGRYAASPDAIGVMRPYILGLVGPAKVYELIRRISNNFTRSARYEAKRTGPNRIEISVIPYAGIKEEPFQCENRIGFFEAIATIFNYRIPAIEHPECIFSGGKSCRYVITWRESRSAFWEKVRNYAAIVFLLFCSFAVPAYPEWLLTVMAPSFAIAVLLLSLYTKNLEKNELISALDHLRGSSDQLMEQINTNYNNALLINEIGLALSKQMAIGSILENVAHILQKRLDYDRGMILLANEDKNRLFFRTGFGYSDDQLAILKNTSFHLDRPESRGVFVVAFHEQKSFLINDIDEIADTLSHRSLMFARTMGTKSFICCPIIFEEEPLGILAVDNIKTKRPLLQSDINLLMGITPEIGISIHNAQLIQARERQFNSILKVLAASIDARDFLTAGHSEKVTEYAVGISREMGLAEEYCEMIRVASLLHDYGKIGIKDSILKKEGKLTDGEYMEIQTHAEKTRAILKQINFEGIYREVPEIAAFHHEKLDGSGYPAGLRGEEIPLGSKIIAVADFFEAVTSKRHYRDPMPADIALKMIEEKRDVHYDGVVIDAFKNYLNKNRTAEVA